MEYFNLLKPNFKNYILLTADHYPIQFEKN